ncbi:AAA family ATPase [Blastococcus xanthinilyticus]|uniref:AAA domain-containing protein n=1 Tax=Blastococcus xanthinilyticus TaxID=1564164 RepID=A0A5S5D3M1_9ACTN|nr:AAA family ATPase [Blastococcus xanthinilyticus]TYP89219.1 AAA domain-containing protein [Blastococcus xanthinilyticus]
MTALASPHRSPAGRAGRGPVLVVIGGLPGSGKTTLLRRILRPGVAPLDSEQVAGRLGRTGPLYRLLRPLVHVRHRVRVLRTVAGGARLVVLTDPWTSRRWRAAVLRAATRAGRRVRVVLIDAPPAAAVGGQVARGRTLPRRRMRRHVRRWAQLLADVAGAGAGAEVVVVGRGEARALDAGQVLGPPAGLLPGTHRRPGP